MFLSAVWLIPAKDTGKLRYDGDEIGYTENGEKKSGKESVNWNKKRNPKLPSKIILTGIFKPHTKLNNQPHANKILTRSSRFHHGPTV